MHRDSGLRGLDESTFLYETNPDEEGKTKKPLAGLLKQNNCGEYRGRTDDLLHAMQVGLLHLCLENQYVSTLLNPIVTQT